MLDVVTSQLEPYQGVPPLPSARLDGERVTAKLGDPCPAPAPPERGVLSPDEEGRVLTRSGMPPPPPLAPPSGLRSRSVA